MKKRGLTLLFSLRQAKSIVPAIKFLTSKEFLRRKNLFSRFNLLMIGAIKYEVVGQHSVPTHNILRDVVIRLTGQRTSILYPERLRLVEAVAEVDGKPKRMPFLTDNLAWAANSICDLCKARWAIEVFFKEIKQTLQLSGFMGYNENAVRWQIWTALLTCFLLRFIA